MKRKLTILISCCTAGSVFVVIFLFSVSNNMKGRPGSFLRLFPTHPLFEIGVVDLGVNSYYLAGGTARTIYLGNYSSPLHALAYDKITKDTTHIELNIEGVHDQKFWSIRLAVDSPYFLVHDGAVPRIYRGDVNDWKAQRFRYDEPYFLDIEPLDKSTFAIKSLSAKNREATLGKISPDSPHYTFRPELLKKQIDGFFCIDGYLRFDHSTSKLVYVYRYRNEFMVMDSGLNLSYKGHTIDTNSIAKINVATIQSTGSRVLSTPPLVVNNGCAVSDNWLFIDSDLHARNEPQGGLKWASVIDVYNLTDGRYRFSFYIFDFNQKEKLRGFTVFGKTLVALFETSLQVFELDEQYFHNSAY